MRHKILLVLAEQDKISTLCVNSSGCFLTVNMRNTEVSKCLNDLLFMIAIAVTMLLLKDQLGMRDTCGCPELLLADSQSKFFLK